MATTKKSKSPLSEKRKKFRPLTKAKYDAIWKLYQAGVNANEIAKKTQTAHSTIRKYIEHGHPARGFQSLKERLNNITVRMQSKIAERHAKERVEHYNKAQSAFIKSLSIAASTMDRAADYQHAFKEAGNSERKGEGRGRGKRQIQKDQDGFDDAMMGRMLKNAETATGLVQKWNEIMTSLYVGEESQQMMKDIESFVETGDIAPGLQAKLRDIIDKGTINSDRDDDTRRDD